MRDSALNYFKTQPWFRLNTAKTLDQYITDQWLDGKDFCEIAGGLLDTHLMIDCVKQFKSWALNILPNSFDIDSDANTKEILKGFVDYVADYYRELEKVVGLD